MSLSNEEILILDNGVLYTKEKNEPYPTNEITNVENGNVILYTENTSPATPVSPFVDIKLDNNWGKIDVDLDAKVCFNFGYNNKATVSSFFCIKVNDEKYVRFEVVRLNSSSKTYLSFGIDNSSNCIDYKDFSDSLTSYNSDQFNHVHLEITKKKIYAKVTIGAKTYEYTTPDLDIRNIKFGLISGSSELTLVPNFKHEYKNILIKYSDPNLTLNIEKPNYVYSNDPFNLTANVKSDFGSVEEFEYLWDTGETTPSITLNRETDGLCSNSCTVSYNGYSVTKTIEYNVITNQVDLSGILGYQNTVCGGLYKNVQKDEVKPQFSSVTSFDYDDPKLYFKANSENDTNVEGYKTNFFDLSSDIDNITLEYDINCPISNQRRNYPAEPLLCLRIQANRWIFVWNEETKSNSNRFCEWIGTIDVNGNNSSTKIYEVNNLIVTNSEIHAKVQISPSKVILNLSFDEKTITRTYNYAVDKRFLGWSFLRLHGTLNYLNPNFTFYVKNFVAYASNYDLTVLVRNEIFKKSKTDLNAYLESLDVETETPKLSKYEIAKFDGSLFVKRNQNNPKFNLNTDVSKIENGIKLTGESNQKFDFRDTLHLQGSENTLSFNIKYNDVSSGEQKVLYHIYLNNGYLITFRASQISFYLNKSTIFYIEFTNEINRKTGINLNGKNIKATFTKGNVKIYADDELVYDYSNANITNYISGFMVNSRVGVATNCELTNLSLTSSIDQTDVRNITKIENNKIISENETVDFETNEITTIEDDIVTIFTEEKSTIHSTHIPLEPKEDWEEIYVDFDVQLNPFSKECSLTQWPMQYLFALQYQQNALFTSKLWNDNNTSDKLTKFGFENEKFDGFIQNYNGFTYINNVLTSKLFTKTSWNHVTVRIKKSQIITYVDFYNDETGTHNYYSYAQNLTINPEYLNLYFALSSTNVRPIQNVFKNKYRNIKVNYTNPDLKLEIINPNERLYSGDDFYLTTSVSKTFGTEKYLWDNNETTSSILLKKDEGVYSTSCIVKCNGYSVENSIEYEVLKSTLFLNGRVIAFQNKYSPNIVYNTLKETINSEKDDISYFETNNPKLFYFSKDVSDTNYTPNKTNYHTKEYDLSTFKDNITLEYDLFCPKSLSKKTNYQKSPILNLRLNEKQYLTVYNESSPSNVNLFVEWFVFESELDSNYFSSSTKIATTNDYFLTENETKVKVLITPTNVTLNLTYDGITKTRTYNCTVDKKYLKYVLYNTYKESNVCLRLNEEFYISNFIAYETGFEISKYKKEIDDLMKSQRDEYIALNGISTIEEPEIIFNDFSNSGEFGTNVTIDASQSKNVLKYKWSSSETTPSITKKYLEETEYSLTVIGKGQKTSTKSFTLLKGYAPELDEHIMWKLCPFDPSYCYFRDDNGVQVQKITKTGDYEISNSNIQVTKYKENFELSLSEPIENYKDSLCKLDFYSENTIGGYGEIIYVYLKNGLYFRFYSNSVNLLNESNYTLNSASCSNKVKTSIELKGNIIEVKQNNVTKLKYIVDIDEYEGLKFDKIKVYCQYSSGNNGPVRIGQVEIQSIDIAEPNIFVTTSNENAECFENVALEISVDQPSKIEYENKEYPTKDIIERLVEPKVFKIKAKNLYDETLVKEVEFAQNVKDLINDIDVKNELELEKIYENQEISIDYTLPTTLPKNAILKYYIDGKEV